ncbi:MAG: hypothetical protein CMJ18_25350 [Phycisphaeraceae bacterium]|nr:hypothetical protein [Phycisphaeraceae bacterium]
MLGLTVGALAAPLFPDKEVLPGPVRSLARLDTVTLHVNPVPPELKHAGITVAIITGKLRERLEQGGIRVVEDDAPDGTTQLHMDTVVSTDASVEDAVAFMFLIRVQQAVRVNRLEDEMDVSTYVAWILDVCDREKFPDAARANIDSVVKGLRGRIATATKGR